MSGANILIVYPRTEGATFDKEYYISTHMPLAKKLWAKHGLKSYAVTELNADAPYSFAVTVEFESYEGFGVAMQDPASKELADDVKNFSNVQSVAFHGPVISRG